MRPLDRPRTAAFALVLLALGHAAGWPVARGGSQAISEAMAAHLRSLGGRGPHRHRGSIDRRLAAVAGRGLRRDAAPASGHLRRSAAAALPGRARPLPLRPRCVQDRLCALGSRAVAGRGVPPGRDRARRRCPGRGGGSRGRPCAAAATHERPYVLVAQQSLVDAGRAPAGCHTLWAYCHVPNGSARGYDRRDRGPDRAVRARVPRCRAGTHRCGGPRQLEAGNPNYVGGDINGGAADLRQVLARPVLRLSPYATPNPRFFLCSASTPPGGGVHGMCGHHAARAALRGGLR